MSGDSRGHRRREQALIDVRPGSLCAPIVAIRPSARLSRKRPSHLIPILETELLETFAPVLFYVASDEGLTPSRGAWSLRTKERGSTKSSPRQSYRLLPRYF